MVIEAGNKDDSSLSFSVPLPNSSSELITVLAHYHRAEIARMAGWRDRLDRTTNWAMTVMAAMLSVSLSTSNSHHGVLLFAILIILLLLVIEARRYRFFDVYRNRVRYMERCYYAQIFAPSDDFTSDWAGAMGRDLRCPVFKMHFIDAIGRRLRRNYFWMFLILLFAWLLKISSIDFSNIKGTAPIGMSLKMILDTAGIGLVPGNFTLIIVGAFYAILTLITLRLPRRTGDNTGGKVHV